MDSVVRQTFTPAEAAKVLGISRSLMYDRIADESVPSFRIGTAIRIRRSVIRALLCGSDPWLASVEPMETVENSCGSFLGGELDR